MKKLLNIYLLHGTASGYDTYDSCVVIAESPAKAQTIHPGGADDWSYGRSWADEPKDVKCELVGQAKLGSKPGVVCSSFNAG